MELIAKCRFSNLHGEPIYEKIKTIAEAYSAIPVNFEEGDKAVLDTILNFIGRTTTALDELDEDNFKNQDLFRWKATEAINVAFEQIGNCFDTECADLLGILIVRVNTLNRDILGIELARIDSFDISSKYSKSPMIVEIRFATNN